MQDRILRAISVAFIWAMLGTGVLHSQTTISGCSVLPSDNVWNAKVDKLPLAQYSASYVSTIGSTKSAHADFGAGMWNGGPIGIPFVVVPGTQAKVGVSFTWPSESDPGPYPIPPNPPIEGGEQSAGDRHVLVLDKDQCVLYELYAAYKNPDGSWRAGAGSRFDLRSNALRPAGWTSADAAGLPILPGLVRYDEVASGEIRHAIRFTAPQTAASYIWPARHKASSRTGTQYPPMGQRFRLKASFDISTFPPQVQVILKALKVYGMILADNGSSWFFSGVPDARWDDNQLAKFSSLRGSDFEAIDESSLMINPDSGQVRVALSASVNLGSAAVIGGASSSNNSITLTTPAPYGGAVIALSSSNMAAASVPASVIVPANATSVTFAITTSPVVSATPVTITAFYLGTPSTASLRVDPGALNTLGLSAGAATGPASLTGTVSLTGGVLGGASVLLTSSNPGAVSVPSAISVLSGAASASFPVTVKAVTASATVTLTASLGGVVRTSTVTVNPAASSPPSSPAPAILNFQLGTNGYSGGQSVTISNKYAAAWNGFNGTTYRTTIEYASLDATSLIRFDQLSIPAGKRLVSATLKLTVTSWVVASLTTRFLKGAWDVNSSQLGWVNSSASTKWTAAGAGGVGSDVLTWSSSAPLKATGEQVINIPLDPVTVAGWLTNPATNQGLRITADKSVTLYSDRNAAVSKRPVLTITVE